MTPDELSRVASEPAPREIKNGPVVMTSNASSSASSSMDDYFTMSRRTNQMTPDELSRVASEPASRVIKNRAIDSNKDSIDNCFSIASVRQNQQNTEKRTTTTKDNTNLHRALVIFQRLKAIDRQERTLREERIKLQDELGAILISNSEK